MTRSLLDSSIEMKFLVSDESPYFFLLITTVQFYLQQMLFVKVINENVA